MIRCFTGIFRAANGSFRDTITVTMLTLWKVSQQARVEIDALGGCKEAL